MTILSNFIDNITGKSQKEAAKSAAKIQAEAATNAAQMTSDATALQRQDLQPFTQFGAGFIDPAQQAVAQSQELFNDPSSIMSNPFFQTLLNDATTGIKQNAALGGRLGTGGTQQHIVDQSLRTGFDVLNQERNANAQNVSMLQNLVGQGQNAATGQAGFTGVGNQVQTGQLTDAASATAAGKIGAANASAAGAGNILNLGAQFLPGVGGAVSDFFGSPAAAPVAAPVGGGTNRFSGNTTGFMA